MVKKTSEKTKITKSKKKKKIPEGRGYINGYFSSNNTILNLSKENGEVLAQVSAGSLGYRGTKKATAFAAQNAVKKIIQEANDYGISNIKLQMKGIGRGRNAVIEEISKIEDLNVEELIDKTPLVFNGTRPRKKPRK